MPEEENSYGITLQSSRLARGLSIKKLSKQSGVSRRHITSAERGSNISIDVLKKLMSALGMTEIEVGDGLSVRAQTNVTPADVSDLLLDLRRSAALTQTVIAKVQSLEQRVGKSIRKHSPDDDDGVVARASALIGEFTAHVGRLRDAAELAKVEKGMSGLFPAGTAERSTPVARRRKRTA